MTKIAGIEKGIAYYGAKLTNSPLLADSGPEAGAATRAPLEPTPSKVRIKC